MKHTFKPTNKPLNTGLFGETKPITFNQLVEVFGEPNGESGDKVSTEWVLEDTETGEIVTIYDYKSTNLYHSRYPEVEEFRKSKYNWHIGGKCFDPKAKSAAKLLELINSIAK